MINSVCLAGNITRDPELRSTANGTAVLLFGIAVNERTKVGEEWKDRPNFFDCKMFGRHAEALAPMLAKGMKVAVDGRLRYESWETEEGAKRSRVVVIANELELMQKREEKQEQTDDIPF